jgi:carbon-monoxide dehydrogenase medium subunit
VLSGGQSLIPAMNLRLVAPQVIVDVGELAELRGIAGRDETLVIGALIRHADLLKSSDIVKCAPLLAAAVARVAHPAVPLTPQVILTALRRI